ncbi:MAG TPA: hypothetical protein VL137_03235 [Polyangiaceae bacterium]|nr:hypothetical protein [Polyangiaceae bacterium]
MQSKRPTVAPPSKRSAAPRIDDSRFFRLEAEKHRLWRRLVKLNPSLQDLTDDREAAIRALHAKEEELTRSLNLIDGWLHSAVLTTVAGLLRTKTKKRNQR